MSVEIAVQELVQDMLELEGYCTKDQAKQIAEQVAKEARQLFESDLKELHDTIDKIQDRENRMWDMLHEKPTPKLNNARLWLSRLWDRLVFWRP